MPVICSALCTICGALSEALIFRLFIFNAQPIDSSSCIPSGLALISSNSVASASQLCRIACSCADTSASRVAVGGTVPGFLRADARTNSAARATASAAMPHHSDDQRIWEYGTIVCAEESAKEPGMICSCGPEDSSLKPGLQVPRMPIASQDVVWVNR